MRYAAVVLASLAPVTLAHAANSPLIPDQCPVTLPSSAQLTTDESEFMHGANSLHVWLPADGRWPGSPYTLRWYYKGASRAIAQVLEHLEVTATRLDGDGPPSSDLAHRHRRERRLRGSDADEG